MVGVRDLGCLALVGANHIAKDDGENDGKANNDESESGVLQTPTTISGLGRGLTATWQWLEPDAVTGVALDVVGVQRVGGGGV